MCARSRNELLCYANCVTTVKNNTAKIDRNVRIIVRLLYKTRVIGTIATDHACMLLSRFSKCSPIEIALIFSESFGIFALCNTHLTVTIRRNIIASLFKLPELVAVKSPLTDSFALISFGFQVSTYIFYTYIHIIPTRLHQFVCTRWGPPIRMSKNCRFLCAFHCLCSIFPNLINN